MPRLPPGVEKARPERRRSPNDGVVPGHREQIADFEPQNQPRKEAPIAQTLEQRRKEAITRELAGHKIDAICNQGGEKTKPIS